MDHTTRDFVVIHPVDPDDAAIMAALRPMLSSGKGVAVAIKEARRQYDALLESVSPRDDVTFTSDVVAGVPGTWVNPANSRTDVAMLHLHGGWFNLGSANAYRHLVGHIAARAGAKAFIPDYRLAPQNPFPAAMDDALACYRGLAQGGVRRIAITGDSAGGNLALGLASSVIDGAAASANAALVGIGLLSPVTDLTLSGASYETRADADPFFTRSQVAGLVHAYLGSADPKQPLASPLYGRLAGLPPVRIYTGDDEVLLDDSRRYAERAIAAGVDVRLDVWMGMPHGFPVNIGRLKAATATLDALGAFLTTKLQARR
jgi:monoterpene epsilon-lactone hydrolase